MNHSQILDIKKQKTIAKAMKKNLKNNGDIEQLE